MWTKGIENKNKLRFLKLIRECIKWEHSDRISVPLTIYRLGKLNLKNNAPLKLKFDDLFNNFQSGRILRIDIDPFYSEIKDIAESQGER